MGRFEERKNSYTMVTLLKVVPIKETAPHGTILNLLIHMFIISIKKY